MWMTFQALTKNKTPAINGKTVFLACLFVGRAVIRPVGARPEGNGHDQGQKPSQSPAWQAEPRNNPAVLIVSKSIPYCTDPWLDTSSNCWPLDKHLFGEVFAVCSSIQTDDPLLWSCRLTPNARAATVRENRGHCLNFYEDTHSLKQCSHLFTNVSGCLYPYQDN